MRRAPRKRAASQNLDHQVRQLGLNVRHPVGTDYRIGTAAVAAVNDEADRTAGQRRGERCVGLKQFTDWYDGQPGTELNFEFYREYQMVGQRRRADESAGVMPFRDFRVQAN